MVQKFSYFLSKLGEVGKMILMLIEEECNLVRSYGEFIFDVIWVSFGVIFIQVRLFCSDFLYSVKLISSILLDLVWFRSFVSRFLVVFLLVLFSLVNFFWLFKFLCFILVIFVTNKVSMYMLDYVAVLELRRIYIFFISTSGLLMGVYAFLFGEFFYLLF